MDKEPKSHKRYPIISFLLSIWTPGLGQIYNGQLTKGIVLLGLTLLAYILLTVFNLAAYFYGFVLLSAIVFLTRIYGAIDAVIWSIKQKEFTFKKYNNIAFYITYAICTFGISAAVVFGGFIGSHLYTIPTTTNSPTIQVGDYVVMNKQAYHSGEIKCGDLVGYNNTENGEIYMSRIIGLPGDILSIKDDIVTINGKESQATFVKNTKCDRMRVAEFTEVLPNGISHVIYKNIDPVGWRKKSDSSFIKVSAGSYFLMGDNRDGSLDSRYKGVVKKEDIIGQMIYVLYRGKDKKNAMKFNIDLRN